MILVYLLSYKMVEQAGVEPARTSRPLIYSQVPYRLGVCSSFVKGSSTSRRMRTGWTPRRYHSHPVEAGLPVTKALPNKGPVTLLERRAGTPST